MSHPQAYGTFARRGGHTFRTSAYIQWGDSKKSIGASLLLNPGSADFNHAHHPGLMETLHTSMQASGAIKPDPTMEQLILFLEAIYGGETPLTGRFHLYNLFNLQNAKSVHAVDQFEALVHSDVCGIRDSLIPIGELQSHPWLLIGWGVERRASWNNLELSKRGWLDLISQAGVPFFGKMHPKHNNYYHPCPRIPTRRPDMLNDLVAIYKEQFGS
ncbi:hypothetical protein [Paenibacillus spongiae]|uniref:DUF1643 domain-containing protein n=1 Tax=Paenibacillus spongiae TaxID=2909671 RepID=A0ABY5SB54_9BACL|nr:hypothetical protein [Paenibacillus spongiae]UVI29760.1 hypothetical protein L1F29_30865 [Paenibacillus spongiae]